MEQKHIPIRMCIICKKRLPKKTLQRYVFSLNKTIAWLDKEQKLPGKGRYICTKETCWKKFQNFCIKG